MAPSLSVVGAFFYRQFFVTPEAPKQRFDGKTVIVTGSNVGLGLEAARHFTHLGAARVIIAVRSIEKGETAKKSIDESSHCQTSPISVWNLDLSSYDSVKDFAARVDKELDRVDIVCENAGINTTNFRTFENDESTITTNVISTFLLAFLLLPKLKDTAKRFNSRTHLAITASEVHFFTDFPERNEDNIYAALSDKQKARMGDRYNVSKLLEVFTVREMGSRTGSDYPVIINCLNPGLCHSELAREMYTGGLVTFVLKSLMNLLARTTEVGSRTIVAAATAGPESHGKYMTDGIVADPSDLVRSDEGARVQKKLWAELVEKLEKIEPGVTSRL